MAGNNDPFESLFHSFISSLYHTQTHDQSEVVTNVLYHTVNSQNAIIRQPYKGDLCLLCLRPGDTNTGLLVLPHTHFPTIPGILHG